MTQERDLSVSLQTTTSPLSFYNQVLSFQSLQALCVIVKCSIAQIQLPYLHIRNDATMLILLN